MENGKKAPVEVAHIALAITILAWMVVDIELVRSLHEQLTRPVIWLNLVEQVVLAVIVNILISGSAVYLITQIGHSKRMFEHKALEREDLEQIYEVENTPTVTIVIPSYKEEPAIVRRTLLSAALVEYPAKRVVLLIDDPPHSDQPADARLLQVFRDLCAEVDALLKVQALYFEAAEKAFEKRKGNGSTILNEELSHLESLYNTAATWFEQQARNEDKEDHAVTFFRQRNLSEPAKQHRARARELRRQRVEQSPPASPAQISREYRRLATLFKTSLSSFERKQYVNLSHEPNKAMNLNSYIALIGERWVAVPYQDKKGSYLRPAGEEEAAVDIPATDYLVTLDADSLLLPDYVLKLIRFMEQPEGDRIAVAQTPYSAFPDAPDLIENIAGATTDMQYQIHQGFTEHGATFWVGANALLRMRALHDIATVHEENGIKYKKFVQDRTVIEDTESSIDLIEQGWRLYNYPERLAYSATPPDFGSLLIQRRRWANGGLLIFPKLVRYLMRGPNRHGKVMEGFLRTHYLTSLAGTNFALILFLVYGFYNSEVSPWLPAAIVPLFLTVALSLKGMGYRYSDLFRVIALNLLLIPVNLSGAIRSIRQGFTGKRSAFGRTPKVAQRTTIPAGIIVAEYGLAAYSLFMTGMNIKNGYWIAALLCLFNGLLFAYAIYRFIGIKNSISDVTLSSAKSWQTINERLILAAKAEFVTFSERGLNSKERTKPLT